MWRWINSLPAFLMSPDFNVRDRGILVNKEGGKNLKEEVFFISDTGKYKRN